MPLRPAPFETTSVPAFCDGYPAQVFVITSWLCGGVDAVALDDSVILEQFPLEKICSLDVAEEVSVSPDGNVTSSCAWMAEAWDPMGEYSTEKITIALVIGSNNLMLCTVKKRSMKQRPHGLSASVVSCAKKKKEKPITKANAKHQLI